MTAFALALALHLSPAAPPPRWSPAVSRRVGEAWPVISACAWLYRLDPQLLAAVGAHETGWTPVTGGIDTDCHGVGQVCWRPNGGRLRREGIASSPAQLRTWIGVLAAARALSIAHREADRLSGRVQPLCVYAGARGERCAAYRRDVARMRVALFGWPALRVALGGVQ